jgi:hypothetical protein
MEILLFIANDFGKRFASSPEMGDGVRYNL